MMMMNTPLPSTRTPGQVTQAFLDMAKMKHRAPLQIIFLKAWMAGVFISFGGLFSLMVQGGSPGLTESNPALVHTIGAFVFPVGLAMILLQQQELLTINFMVFPMAVIRGVIPWWSLPLNWITVFFGNLSGALFFAALLTKYSGVVATPAYHAYLRKFIVTRAIEPDWHEIFLRGVACNWLVCIAVWQALAARDTVSKIFALWIPVWTFVACGFDHVIANMFTIPLGIMMGADFSTAHYIRKSLLASLIGNITGALCIAFPFLYFYWNELTPLEPPASKEKDLELGRPQSAGSDGTRVPAGGPDAGMAMAGMAMGPSKEKEAALAAGSS